MLILMFNCQKERNINGNYYVCQNGEYIEVYFKKDSMRVVSDDHWVKLTEWEKIEIKNDTLHFETFGEWRMPSKAKIEYVEKRRINLIILVSKNVEVVNLKSIYENVNSENSEAFWNGFYKRLNSSDCN